MKIRVSEIISFLFTLLVLFSASSLATISSSQELPRSSQFPDDNRRKPIPTLNANSNTESAKTESGEKVASAQMTVALRSSLESSLQQFLQPDKVVLSCDAVELFQHVGSETINNAMKSEFTKNVNDEAATKQFVSEVQDRFNKFLKAQLEGGEKLRRGKILITAESFNATTQRFCPLIPIC
jgi:hypothetical protein